jgi:hypothetical protein
VGNLFRGPALREQSEDRRAQAGLDREHPELARVVGAALRPLVSGHRSIGDGRGVVASEFTEQGTRSSAQRLPDGSETRSSGQHATHLFVLLQTQAVIVGHVQLLGSWFDQDTGVALGS